MSRVIFFIIVSVFNIIFSRKTLLHPNFHGFYRFFAWECMLALGLLNILYWFKDPLSLYQIISWILLVIAVFLVANGVYMLKLVGKPDQKRNDDKLIAFEKTSALVTVGVYKYIRHPLYSSLLFLAWGALLKHLSWPGLILAVFSSLFLYLTAKNDEVECLEHFGDEYRVYMRDSKRFIPFLF
jgi:protein-S-isoprenylcysteine O-methyltransferase Ste14